MSASLSFTECMHGFVGFGQDDFDRGARAGREDRTPLEFRLTMRIDDIDRFEADPRREARAEGWVRCEALGGTLAVETGVFNLFVDEGEPGLKRMLYRLHFRDGVGRTLTLSGYKAVKNDPGLDLWSDTSTLYTRVLQGRVGPAEEDRAEVVAAGILRIRIRDFLRMLTTVRPAGPSRRARAMALARFGLGFARQLLAVYGRRPRA